MRRKFAVVTLAFAIVMVASAIAPVIALGPENNPHADAGTEIVYLVTPSHSHNVLEFIQDGRINHYMSAKPTGKGIMNNVNLVVDSPLDLMYLGQHREEFMAMPGWICLSGDMSEGGTWSSPLFPGEGEHGAFYWFLRIFEFPAEAALEVANNHPYGVYLGGHDLGWS